jgi:hypothetical protein
MRRLASGATTSDPRRSIVDPEIKTRWLEALRSGHYRQGKHKLRKPGHRATPFASRRDPEFCCLGVLCELAVEAGVVERKLANVGTDVDKVYWYHDPGSPTVDRSSSTLPLVVRDWAGLADCDPPVVGHKLSYWNDVGEWKFNSIADLIEAHL